MVIVTGGFVSRVFAMHAHLRSTAAFAAVLGFIAIGATTAQAARKAAPTDTPVLRTILVAASAPLDDRRIQSLVGVPTTAACTHFNGEAPTIACSYVPTRQQKGAVQLVSYAAAGPGPGVMTVGSVEWKLDRARLCLKEPDLERAFGSKSGPARFPIEPQSLPGGLQPEIYRSYDFMLGQEESPNWYVAVYEVDGCVQSLRLSMYTPPVR